MGLYPRYLASYFFSSEETPMFSSFILSSWSIWWFNSFTISSPAVYAKTTWPIRPFRSFWASTSISSIAYTCFFFSFDSPIALISLSLSYINRAALCTHRVSASTIQSQRSHRSTWSFQLVCPPCTSRRAICWFLPYNTGRGEPRCRWRTPVTTIGTLILMMTQFSINHYNSPRFISQNWTVGELP